MPWYVPVVVRMLAAEVRERVRCTRRPFARRAESLKGGPRTRGPGRSWRHEAASPLRQASEGLTPHHPSWTPGDSVRVMDRHQPTVIHGVFAGEPSPWGLDVHD
jgi:hypothetical protein